YPDIGNPVDVLLMDVDGDGRLDAVVTLANERLIATLPGNPDGSFGKAAYSPVPSVNGDYTFFPEKLAPGNFTGTGRVDVAISSGAGVATFANVTGGVNMTIRSSYPVVSAGQSITFDVKVVPIAGYQTFSSVPIGPFPTGTVTLQENATALGNATTQ